LKKCGITIIFLNRPDSKDTPEDNLLSGVQGLIAEYEKAKILERTRRGKIHKAKNGIIVSGTPPYGYRCVDGSYLIDPNEAEVVKLVFKSFTEDGMKMRSIAKELIRRNIRSRKGGFWRPNVIYSSFADKNSKRNGFW
jgi:site-specific DNA recombinase